MDHRPGSGRLLDTAVTINAQPAIIRHQLLNPIRHNVSLHSFLSRIDYLATSLDSPAFAPSSHSLSYSSESAIQILNSLYAFAIEPRWAPHFFPKRAFHPIPQTPTPGQPHIERLALPEITSSFSLTSAQGEEAIEYGENRRGKPCGHVFQKGEGVYHCSDCGIDPTCALCARCFLASDHTGHDVTYSIHATGCGCCDCGDEEAWKKDIMCKYHSPAIVDPAQMNSDHNHQPTYGPLPQECKKVIEQIVTIALDFLLITVDRSPEDMSPPADVEAIYDELSRLEENAYLELSRNPPTMSDNAMDVDLQYSHHHNAYHLHHHSLPNAFDDSNKPSVASGLFSALLGSRTHDKGKGKITDTPSSSLAPAPPPSTPSSFGLMGDIGRFKARPHLVYPSSSLTAQGSSSSVDHWPKWAHLPSLKPPGQSPRGAGPWGVVLWNDEKHSYAQVIDEVSKATGCSRAEALRIANTVDTKGREVIQVSCDPNVLLQTSKMISRIDLTVTVRTAHDLFCEQIADLVISFLVDLASCRIYQVCPEDESWVKLLITQKLCERPEVGYDGGDRTRFARLLLNDVKLWKDARDRLKSLYISLLALGQSVKLQLGILFASVFPQLIEYNLLVDREPEHNILLFSLQIVTVPSVIVVLVSEHGFLKMILDLLYAFFTHQFLPPDGESKHLVYPPDYTKRTIDPEGASFRHKRYYHLFHELNLVLSSPGVQRAICADVNHLRHLLTFLDLFSNMNPNQRAVHLHVEFESDAWVTAFNLTIQLAKLCKFFGECYAQATPHQFVAAVHCVVQKLVDKPHEFHEVQFGSCEGSGGAVGAGVTYRCIDFKTDREPISFHHPLNWLLAEMMRSVHKIDFSVVNHMGVYGIGELLVPPGATPDTADVAPLQVSEDVIRVSSLLAQVRAGLWVRNGFGVRAQQLHYREYSLRETTFDQDIFHLQVLLAAKDPSHVLVAIVDRFGLRQWCNGELLTERIYEPGQTIAMLEELLHLLIILLSEPAGIGGLSQTDSLRREIVHVLCLGPMAYSDILKRIPDRYMQDSGFDLVLGALTDFKPPVGTSDVGIYTLKTEYLKDVDPYYCRFGRNQREESERIVLEHLKKVTGETDPVLVPKSLNITSGPFACISQAYHSEVLLQIVFYALARVNPTMKGYSEYLADQAIHLVMMGLVEQPNAFASMAIEKKLPLKGANPHTMSLMMMLEAVDGEPAMRSVKKKVNWCLDRVASIVGLSRPKTRQTDSTNNAAQMAAQADEQKKEAAKARQNAIMNQFAAAQQAFLLQHDLGDDEDEDEDEEAMSTGKTAMETESEKVYGNCIVCQEDLTKARCFGALGLVQCSRMVRLTPLNVSPEEMDVWLQEASMVPESLDVDGRADGPAGVASTQPVNLSDTRIGPDGSLEPVPWTSLGFPTRENTKPGMFASACGHLMHLACFQTYYKSIELRHGTQVTRNHPESIERCEYLCPLCKSIGNVFLPSIDLNTSVVRQEDATDLVSWLSSAETIEEQMRAETGLSDYSAVLQLSEAEMMEPWLVHERLQPVRRVGAGARLGSEERTMLERFLMVTGALGREYANPAELVRAPSLPGDLVGYTVGCLEIASRGTATGLELTETQRQLVSSLLALLGWLVEAESGYRNAKLYATGLLMRLLTPPTDGRACAPIVLAEPLSLLVHCAAVCPAAFGMVIPLCYYLELLRVLIGLCDISTIHPEFWKETQWGGVTGKETDTRREREGAALLQLLGKVAEKCGVGACRLLEAENGALERLVRLYTLPFLRRAQVLKQVIHEGGLGASATAARNGEDEHGRLRKALGVPSMTDILTHGPPGSEDPQKDLEMLGALLFGWMNHLQSHGLHHLSRAPQPSTSNFVPQPPFFARHFTLEHPVIYELLGLPVKFDKLLSEAATRRCTNCGEVPNDPGVCLLCGEVVCVQAFCCTRSGDEEDEHGECNVHMWNCGGSIGIYLLIKKCSTLFLATENGTFMHAPYLDEHGEHDVNMKRGRPQFLHQARWDEIRKIWLTHGVPTHVARRQESSTDVGGWPTF